MAVAAREHGYWEGEDALIVERMILMEKPSGGAGRGGGASSGAVAGAPGGNAAQSSAPASIAAEVAQAVESFSTGVPIRIATVLDLIDGDRDAAKAQLRQMQLQRRVVLYPIDVPRDITERDRNAAINIGGEQQMIMYRLP